MDQRAELARRVLAILANEQSVPTSNALQLRAWAIGDDGATLSLEEIAHRILNEEENPNSRAAKR